MRTHWYRLLLPFLLAGAFILIIRATAWGQIQFQPAGPLIEAAGAERSSIAAQLPPQPAALSGPPIVYTDVTAAAGIAAVHTSVIDYWTTGQAWGDYNNDGWLDLYVTDSNGPNTLYENVGGSFQVSSLSSQVALTNTASGGANFTDFDNDGWTDLYVLNWGANKLYRNLGGTGFADYTSFAGVGDTGKGETASWGDFDEDGNLDLYVANWHCDTCVNPPGLEGNRDRLYRSNGNGTFTDITMSLGMTQTLGAGFVASFVDYDNDQDLDIYLINDRFKGPNVNILWRNDGPGCGDWCFKDVSKPAGADTWVAGMGLAIHDYDHDGDLDFYFSNAGPAVLLQNQTSQGSPTFVDVAPTAGVDYNGIHWGTVPLDYDNDGWNDLYLAILEAYPGTENYLARNLGDGTFETAPDAGGAPSSGQTLGVAYADYDNDGWVDLAIGNYGQGYQLYRNQGASIIGNNWLTIDLNGVAPINREAIGSRVTLYTSDGERQLQELASGSSLGAGNTLDLHFGLGSSTVVSATVYWPNGDTQTYYDVPINTTWSLTHPLPAYTDVSAGAGISMAHHTEGYVYLATGQAWGDYNSDGYLDLYLTDQLGPNQLLVNNGDGTFDLSPFADEVALPDSKSGGAVFADYDNDGWTDLYVLNWGVSNLFHNDEGNGFTDVTAIAGVGTEGTGETAAWADYDQDGLLDLYVVTWGCPLGCDETPPDRLYHNNGDGAFTDVSDALSLVEREKPGFTASFLDFDNDQDLDLYVVNDFETGNTLWRNDGPGCTHWCFTDISVASGANTGVYGMGLAVGDYDLDGDFDLYFSDADPAVLLQSQVSQGSDTFIDVSVEAGVDYDAPQTVSWGTVFFDYDNNTWPDLYLATMNSVGPAPSRLFHNQGDGTFADYSMGNGAEDPGKSMGVAYADYDLDGDLDLIVGNFWENYALYRNDSEAAAANHWLAIKLVGVGPVNRDAIGTRVYVDLSDGRTLMQEVKDGSSLGAGNQLALHFGLGPGMEGGIIDDVTVVWPDGISQLFVNPPIDQYWTLRYPQPSIALSTESMQSTQRTNLIVSQELAVQNIGGEELAWTIVEDGSILAASGACDAPADIPWLSVDPANGATPPGGSSPVEVTFNSTGYVAGTYDGNLCVTSNDPDHPLMVVAVQMVVQTPTDVGLSAFAGGGIRVTAEAVVSALLALLLLLGAHYVRRRAE